MSGLLAQLTDFIKSTNILKQIQAVDITGLFTNPWFLVPFIIYIGYLLYRQAVNSIVMMGLVIVVWIFSGTSYATGLVVDGIIQINKILPVAAFGIGVVAVAVYFLFMRSD